MLQNICTILHLFTEPQRLQIWLHIRNGELSLAYNSMLWQMTIFSQKSVTLISYGIPRITSQMERYVIL